MHPREIFRITSQWSHPLETYSARVTVRFYSCPYGSDARNTKNWIKQYEGENVKKCITDIFDKCNRLETAGELPKNTSLIVCEIFAACSVEEFCLQFMMKRFELTSNSMLATDYQELIILANNTYQTLVDAGKWFATPPEDTALMTLHAKVDKLIQRAPAPQQQKKKKLTCFNCGQERHYANHCPCPKENKEGAPKSDEKRKPVSWKRCPKEWRTRRKVCHGFLRTHMRARRVYGVLRKIL